MYMVHCYMKYQEGWRHEHNVLSEKDKKNQTIEFINVYLVVNITRPDPHTKFTFKLFIKFANMYYVHFTGTVTCNHSSFLLKPKTEFPSSYELTRSALFDSQGSSMFIIFRELNLVIKHTVVKDQILNHNQDERCSL